MYNYSCHILSCEIVICQDRLYEIDRSWRNSLVFNGIKTDGHGCYESPECTEGKVRQILKNHLNIGREIIINRCHRVYNGADKFGNKPVVVNFHVSDTRERIELTYIKI